MNFIHIADVHLGAAPEANTAWKIKRDKEIYETFLKVIEVCEEERIDILLIAGDLFHRQPLLRELKEVNYMFSKLSHTKVVIIAGNHDYIGIRSNYMDFKWNENVLFLSNKDMDSIFIEELNTEIYGFSYHTRDIYEARYDNAFCTVEERINILLAHGGDERNIPINYKQLDQAGFDYVALGHIHKPEIISNKMAYSGSLEPMDKNETGERGYIYGRIQKSEEKGCEIKLNFVPFCKRQYKNVSIPVTTNSTNYSIKEDIIDILQKEDTQNMFIVTLEGRRDPEVLIHIKEIYEYGNIIEVIDQVLPDYDFDQLYFENKDNLIGAYISRIRTHTEDEDLVKKALYYGIEALLNTKER